MSDNVIEIRDLSKQYRLGQVGTGTISHDLNRWWARMRGKEDPYATVGQINRRDQKAESEYVWALKDINLDVKRGEVLGIIGGNGAGKSTLLKLISRITSPSTGYIRAKGRIASLLEVGTGMHPEMTARENIYLNGAILGMRRHEIKRKFDDIIDFAGCQLYVDTPVKRYSSGMRVRLGFAVAAFLEPEILIVDEVLAVGDAEFQKRAIGKMQEVSKGQGRTVLFVSHNMATISAVCNTAAWLNNGSIHNAASAESIIKQYIYSLGKKTDTWINLNTSQQEYILNATLLKNENKTITFYANDCLSIDYTIGSLKNLKSPSIGAGIHLADGTKIFTLQSKTADPNGEKIKKSKNSIRVTTEKLNLTPGEYYISIGIASEKEVIWRIESALRFEVIPNNTSLQYMHNSINGLLFMPQKWNFH